MSAVNRDLTRREVLALLGVGAPTTMLPEQLGAMSAPSGATPFSLGDVHLLDGPFQVNERESGNMLNATIDIPTLAGKASELTTKVRAVRGEPLLFETVGLGKPNDVKLAPFNRLAHERYNFYWRVQGS